MQRFCFLLLLSSAVACGGDQLDAGTNDAAPAPDAGASDSASSAESGVVGATPCTVGSDQTCNHDPAVSAIYGTCTKSGRCECKPGFQLYPGGKCGKGPGGLGSSCTSGADCKEGMECLEFTAHPKPGECNVVSKMCTFACDDSAQAATCENSFGSRVRCFAGCEGTAGICALGPE